jgi:hypothetical protein
MYLKANKTVDNYTTIYVDLNDIYSKRDDAAIMDPKFVDSLHKSLDEKGMEYPIILRNGAEENTGFPYACWIGNNRIHYAKVRGYTHIAGILAETITDKRNIFHITNMKYCEDF